MKKLLLAFGLVLWSVASAIAQCVSVAGAGGPAPQFGITCASESTVPSYAATGVGIVPAASATDIACLTGSATKVVRLQSIRVSGSGTAISVPVHIMKRATADTAGTLGTGAVLPVPYRLDSANVAPSATTVSYTANPTINDSAPGIIDNGNLGVVATSVGAAVQPFVDFSYINRNFMQAPTLRGVAQQICVNLAATSPTALLDVTFKWTESAQ